MGTRKKSIDILLVFCQTAILSITNKYKMNTEYVKLTDLWNNGEYAELGHIMKAESWKPSEVAEFCAYFAKYCGLNQLNILYKFL